MNFMKFEMIGILYLKKTYGRHKDKLLYKFIPYGEESCCLVPYSIKSSFSKLNEDLYVICKDRVASTPYDRAVLESCIGSINSLSAYYEYELYRKQLVRSLKPFHATVKEIAFDALDFAETVDKSRFVFTIDSSSTTDFEDAISIHYENDVPVVSVYIANVPLILEKYQLWDSMTDKTATIYLPDKKRNMLPQPLETFCSLHEGCSRLVYVMEIVGREIRFSTKSVTISRNFVYEEPALLKNTHYKRILRVVQALAEASSFYMETPKDSYGLIVYLMIFMNHQCAVKLEGRGILRKVTRAAPREVPDIFGAWMSWFGEYALAGENNVHEMIGVEYSHVTSPIRRLVDIVNLALLQGVGRAFCEKWLKEIAFINDQMKRIKKVQNNCELMKKCTETTNREYNAVALKGCIYIPELKMMTKTAASGDESGAESRDEPKKDIRVQMVIVSNKEAFKKVKFIPF